VRGAALVRVEAVGYTPASHPPTEVSMLRIGLAVVLALSISASFDIEARQPARV